MRKIALIGFLIFIPALLLAESPKKHIREGNKLYEDGKYKDAEISYRKSLEAEPNSLKGTFNLGDALYKQGEFEDATDYFSGLAGKDIDKKTKAKIYHNLGNSLLESQKYKESIEAYKQALINNPKDMDTKYNLEYAKRMLQQQQQQQNQQNKNQDKNQENKDQQNKQNQQDKQDQQQQDQQQQQQDKKKQDQQQQQQANKDQQKKGDQKKGESMEEKKISKKDAQRILQALQREELDVQKKLRKQKRKSKKLEKNW